MKPSPSSLPARRMANQRLTGSPAADPAEVVRWMGALQSQDYLASLWAVGARLAGATETDVERAIAEATIVRTWPMRRTLHLVPAEDAHWMVELLTPRILKRAESWHGKYGLDAAEFRRSRKVLTTALKDGSPVERSAVMARLERAGIATAHQRGMHIVVHHAHEGVICLGPRHGKQQTLVLLDAWVPRPRRPSREEALALLARRYLQSHGPATAHDFAWWTGLTVVDARNAIASLGSEPAREALDGATYYSTGAAEPPGDLGVHLLPGFDEYTVGYRDRQAVLDPAHAKRVWGNNGIIYPIIVADGRVVGTWRRTLRTRRVEVAPEPFRPFPARQRGALTRAVERYAAFLGLNPAAD